MAGLVIGTTDVPVGRLASRLDCNPQKEERSLSAPTYTVFPTCVGMNR